jgi:cyanate permease
MWRKWWLLFTVIWVVVAALQAALILATSEETGKAIQPALLAVAVPAALYLIGWLWTKLRAKRNSGTGP